MSALYTQILDAVEAQVAALPGLVAAKALVVQRKLPAWVPLQDALPQVIIAPREDQSEEVADLRFEAGCDLVFEVYVGIVVLATWEPADARWRRDRREDVRLALWSPRALAASAIDGLFDCDYDPRPPVPKTWTDGLDASWQRFDFSVSANRTTVSNG